MICPYCNNPAAFVDNAAIYGKDDAGAMMACLETAICVAERSEQFLVSCAENIDLAENYPDRDSKGDEC